MKKLNAGAKKILCANDTSPFRYYAWPSITRLPDGTLAVAASGLRLEHICPFGKGVIAYSRDEGETWTAPSVVMDTPLDDRDCGLTVFGEGRVILTSFNNTTAMQRYHNSRRRSRAETAPELAKCDLIDAYLNYVDALNVQQDYIGSTYRISNDGGYSFGPIHRMPVTAPHGPCRLLDGSLLYVGRRFSDDDSFDSGAKPFVECWTLDENDEPAYLTAIENVSDEYGLLNSCEPHAIQLPDGRIIVHIRMERGGEHPSFSTWQSVSADGGKTFSRPEPLVGPQGGAPAHLLLHSGGTLISVYGYRQAPYGVRAMLSRDGGRTWEPDWILDDECPNWDLGYPATVELKDGSLLTVYYQNVDGVSRIVQRRWTLPE